MESWSVFLFKVLFDTGGHGYTGTPQKSDMDTRPSAMFKGSYLFSNHPFGYQFVSFRGCVKAPGELLVDLTIVGGISTTFRSRPALEAHPL